MGIYGILFYSVLRNINKNRQMMLFICQHHYIVKVILGKVYLKSIYFIVLQSSIFKYFS